MGYLGLVHDLSEAVVRFRVDHPAVVQRPVPLHPGVHHVPQLNGQ